MAPSPRPQGPTSKVASYLSRLNPVPGFPEYTGPHKVGTIDVEIPVSELESPSPPPPGSEPLHTVQFRIFYPATPDSDGKKISWLPAPQRSHVSAYTKFLGLGPILAEFVSFLPRHLHYTSIPVHKNAALLDPDTPCERWPTMVFSHGLGGNRNAYSHLVGNLASHGVVVVCPEHRDGSSAISFVRDPAAAQDGFFKRSTRTAIPYRRIPHTESPEIWDARNQQLKIRLWELGLVYEALLGISLATGPDDDDNDNNNNNNNNSGGNNKTGRGGLTNLNGSTPPPALQQFGGKLQVQEPGSIIWAGHSFGAASIVQFLKSTYYAGDPEVAAEKEPLFRPAAGSRVRAQITERSPTILLDMWCFPLLAASTRALHDRPLPVYAADVASAPGGTALLAVESETFFKWTVHLHTTAKIVSPDPAAAVVSAAAFARPSGARLPEPSLFYVQNSAHLNQSDFGLLFPWLTRKVFGADQPERALRLNLRAILQMLRANGVPVARTWVGDLVDGGSGAGLGDVDNKLMAGADGGGSDHVPGRPADGIHDDKAILDRSGEAHIEAWRWIDIIGLGGLAGDRQPEAAAAAAVPNADEEQQMAGEIEPHLASTEPLSEGPQGVDTKA